VTSSVSASDADYLISKLGDIVGRAAVP
jgi:hypothetical protein